MNAIGIDLGTTYSAIAQWRVRPQSSESEVYYLSAVSQHTCASKVFIEQHNGSINFIIGPHAITKGMIEPERYISSVKRLMDENLPIDVSGKTYTPVEISSEILKFLLAQVEAIVGPNSWIPEGIVVTVPYYFLQTQLKNTSDALKLAIKNQFGDRFINKTVKRYGKEISIDDIFLGLVPEPIAASLDYAFNVDAEVQNETIMVFDLGGGTFDLTVFSLNTKDNNGNPTLHYEILAVDGDSRLGGEDFDESLFKYICEQEDIDIASLSEKERGNFFKLVIPKITDLKEALAFVQSDDLMIANLLNMKDINITITRNDLLNCLNGEQGNKINYFGDISRKIDEVLTKANTSINQISSVLLTGGSSKLFAIREELLRKGFLKKQIKDIPMIDLAVARGAAIYAAYELDKIKEEVDPTLQKYLKDWSNIQITERNPHDLGVLLANGNFGLILKNNTITPTEITKTYIPSELSNNGTIAELPPIKILQGKPNKFAIIGEIDVGNIFTHGRAKERIRIRITFMVDTTNIKVKIFVEEGNQDKSDINVEKELSLDSK